MSKLNNADLKSEYRNPKPVLSAIEGYETNPNLNCSKHSRNIAQKNRKYVSPFLFWSFEIVSSFDIRISDFLCLSASSF